MRCLQNVVFAAMLVLAAGCTAEATRPDTNESTPVAPSAKAEMAPEQNAEMAAPQQSGCDTMRTSAVHHHLPVNKDTVHWGFFSKGLDPKLTIKSGDRVTVETLTHHAAG